MAVTDTRPNNSPFANDYERAYARQLAVTDEQTVLMTDAESLAFLRLQLAARVDAPDTDTDNAVTDAIESRIDLIERRVNYTPPGYN